MSLQEIKIDLSLSLLCLCCLDCLGYLRRLRVRQPAVKLAGGPMPVARARQSLAAKQPHGGGPALVSAPHAPGPPGATARGRLGHSPARSGGPSAAGAAQLGIPGRSR